LENVNLNENYQLLIICDASSSTLVGNLTSHETVREYNKIRVHKSVETYEEKIQIESHHKLQKTWPFASLPPNKIPSCLCFFYYFFFCFLRRSPLFTCAIAYINISG
jgi:hypothetical protein